MRIKWKTMKFERYIFEILLAVELIMSFTFLGYIHVEPISITTAFIPIVMIACLYGPTESTIAGMIFGLGSLYKASAQYVMPGDMIFSPFRSGFPIESLILSVGTRTLFGFLIGWLFVLARKGKHPVIWKTLCALIAPELHATLVYSAMGLLFPSYGFTYRSALGISWNDLLVAVLCVVCVLLADRVYHGKYTVRYREAINETENNLYRSSKINVRLCAITVFIVAMAVVSTIYFSDRISYMLTAHGVEVTEVITQDVLHLQVQFLAAMLSLNFILIIVILMVYRYMKYREYRGEIDYLTGTMGRRLFLQYCAKCQAKAVKRVDARGWFLFLDVDWFKQINDTLGHAMGDSTLKKVARCLQNTFENYGVVGRVGGDEFAVLIDQELTREQLEKKLKHFQTDISHILQERTVSCSIGAYHFTFPKEVNVLLKETDHVLYQAKEKGRACYVIEEE